MGRRGRHKTEQEYCMKRKAVARLRKPAGRVFRGRFPESFFPARKKIVVVGDSCALKVPSGSIFSVFYDGRTRRRKISENLLERIRALPIKTRISVENPRGKITLALWAAAKMALKRRTMVFVEGEEDLAALAISALAPDGTILVYGVPGRGSCVSEIDSKRRAFARRIVSEKDA
ncbi:MAG: DUF359 domain-containing protein [archaeon]